MKRFYAILVVCLLILPMLNVGTAVGAEDDTLRIEFENYDSASAENVEVISNDLRGAVYATEPDSLTFLEYLEGGSYIIKLNGATISDSLVSVVENGEEIAAITLSRSGAYENNYAFAALKNGNRDIDVVIKKGDVCLDYIEFVPASINADFVRSINSASSAEEVRNLFIDNASSLGVKIEELEKGIFYPAPIYASLLGRNFETCEEIYELLSKSISKEIDFPKVSLKSGVKKLTALADGDLKVTLKGASFEGEEVYGVIYKNGEEAYRSDAEILDNEAIMQFDAVALQDGAEYSFDAFIGNTSFADILTGVYRNIYVSPNGSDSASGTKTAPFKTLERAKEEIGNICHNMTGDIVINVESGYYKLSKALEFDNSNTAKNGYKVIIRGTDKENQPLISGGKKVEGWEDSDGDGIYRARLSHSSDVRKLYVNGYPALRAITEKTYKIKSVYKDDDATYSIDGIIVDKSTFPYQNLKHLEEVEFVWPLYWTESRTKAESVIDNGSTLTFLMAQPIFAQMDKGTNKWGIQTQSPFYLENAMEFLDSEGEFYYDKSGGYIYYYPYKEENMSTADVYIGETEQLIKVNGANVDEKIENFVLENLEFRYGAMNYVSESGIVNTQAEIFGGSNHIPFQLEFNNAKGIEIRNCRFACLGSGAVSMTDGVEKVLIEQNTFRDLSGGGVIIGTPKHQEIDSKLICCDVLVKNNVFRRIGDEYRTSIPVSSYYEKNIKIISNDIKDVPYSGLSVGWGWGRLITSDWGVSKISHNRIENVMLTLNDGAQIYTLGPMRNSSIDNNYLLNSEYVLSGVYTDSGSAYINIYNNVMDDDAGSYWWYQGHDLTHDLTAYGNYSREGTRHRESGDGTNKIESHNYVAKNSAWPDEAQRIIDESGVEKKYAYLLDGMELPSWRTNIAERLPKGL